MCGVLCRSGKRDEAQDKAMEYGSVIRTVKVDSELRPASEVIRKISLYPRRLEPREVIAHLGPGLDPVDMGIGLPMVRSP